MQHMELLTSVVLSYCKKDIYIYNIYNKTILIEIFTSSFFLSDDATQSVNNSVVFGNGNKKVTIQELLDTSSDESFIFTGGNKHKKNYPGHSI